MIAVDRKRSIMLERITPEELERERKRIEGLSEEFKGRIRDLQLTFAREKARARVGYERNIERVRREREKIKERLPRGASSNRGS